MDGPITIEDLGLEPTFKRFDRLADLLEEVNMICDELKEEGIEINFNIELA